jgi:membrane-associated phospholipid phosphatase
VRWTARSALLAAAGCWIAFAAVLVCAYEVGAVGRLDATALHGLMSLRSSLPDRGTHLVAHCANPLPLLATLAGLFALGWALGRRRQAVAAVGLVAGAYLTAQVLKLALAHPRLHPILGDDQVRAAAFPSGHATAAMSIALAALVVAPPWARIPVVAAGTVYVVAITGSILVLGWHFPSDVLGGFLLAWAFFFGAIAALRIVEDRASVAARARARPASAPISFNGRAADRERPSARAPRR